MASGGIRTLGAQRVQVAQQVDDLGAQATDLCPARLCLGQLGRSRGGAVGATARFTWCVRAWVEEGDGWVGKRGRSTKSPQPPARCAPAPASTSQQPQQTSSPTLPRPARWTCGTPFPHRPTREEGCIIHPPTQPPPCSVHHTRGEAGRGTSGRGSHPSDAIPTHSCGLTCTVPGAGPSHPGCAAALPPRSATPAPAPPVTQPVPRPHQSGYPAQPRDPPSDPGQPAPAPAAAEPEGIDAPKFQCTTDGPDNRAGKDTCAFMGQTIRANATEGP
jgi:hypothetical protein